LIPAEDLRAGEANTGDATATLSDATENCIPGHINLYPQLREVQIHKTPHKTPHFELLNLNLSVVKRIRAGQRPTQIARELGISKTALQYHLNQLKAAGVISKIGYGVWEVNISASKEVQITSHVGHDKTPHFELLKSPDTVRGHAFVFTLQVPPRLTNWRRREGYLGKQGIAYQQLRIAGGAQRLWLDGRKVWLTDRSIVIYEQASYFADTATNAKESALVSFLAVVKKLEHLLSADFTFRLGKEYRFKVSRQHYALVKNALAEQYDHEGQRLQIREPTAGHLWFVIDNSFDLHEAETIHPETAEGDNRKVQDFFNSLKEHPLTTDFVIQAIAGVAQNQIAFAENQQMYAENTSTHVQAVKELGQGVHELNRLLAQLEEKLEVAP